MNVARQASASVILIAFLGSLLGACNPSTEVTTIPGVDTQASGDLLVNRVWSRVDAGAAPGSVRIFLSDGVLVQDSCFETYRLSQWRRESPTRIGWSEDGVDIAADVVHSTHDALTLRIVLQSEEVVESYVIAASPYVCPDMPRQCTVS
jgi:hypothetical protein